MFQYCSCFEHGLTLLIYLLLGQLRHTTTSMPPCSVQKDLLMLDTARKIQIVKYKQEIFLLFHSEC